ncbi:MAG: glycoside hydrolase family 2 protein, partial [Desulfobulbaceae bacterium]|nr:glycoside hydrolase family 2 protein [Desulfobulbaceae bacterium]
MKLIDLNGSWRVRAVSKKKWVPASVPGSIHTDLMAAGLIPDPFLRDHEADLQWIGRERWVYEREFDTPRCSPQADVVLRCDGLDTLATVMVNGEVVGHADNMHRGWRFDLRGRLREDVNTLTIRFDSPLDYLAQRQAAHA